MWSRRALLTGTAALGGCSLRGFPFTTRHGSPGSGLSLTYFTVGCSLISHGGVSVLTDPFWSHLPLGRVLFGPVVPDPTQVEPMLPATLSQVQAVVVGHGHYDHVMGLPEVVDRLSPSAQVIAGRSVANTYAPMGLTRSFVHAENHLSTPTTRGEPIELPGLRVWPLRSGHPPQWAFFHGWRKDLDQPARTAPHRLKHYQEGQPLAYLLDFLAPDGAVAKRVFVETSSTGLPAGLPPDSLRDRPVDLAMVSMDVARAAARGSETILDVLQPPEVVFCHWENFFRSRDKPPREAVKVHLRQLRRDLPDSPQRTHYFPMWGAQLHFS